jgi:hypothetical protein
MQMGILFDFISKYWLEIIGILLTYFGLILPILKYLNLRKIEERDKRFINFHRLVKEFVEPDPITKMLMLDRQIAVVYEFRNYPEYFELINRLLHGLREQWKDIAHPRLLTELDLTLDYIKYKRSWFLIKIFKKRP